MTDEKGCFSEKDRLVLANLLRETTGDMLTVLRKAISNAETPKEKDELHSLGERQTERMDKIYIKILLNMCNPPEDIEKKTLFGKYFLIP